MFSRLINAGAAARASQRSVHLAKSLKAIGTAEREVKSTLMDRLFSYRSNGLLSRPSTQIRNMSANSATLAMRPLETLGSAAVDKLIGSKVPGEKIYFTEAVHEVYGMMAGIKDAFKMGRFMFADSDKLRVAAEKQNIPGNLFASRKWEDAEIVTSGNKFKDTWAEKPLQFMEKALTSPGQALQGVDNLFKILNYRSSMHRYLSREALSKGVTGRTNILKYIEEGMNNPDDIFNKRSILDAEVATFTDPWNSKTMQKADSTMGNDAFRWLFPFRKAPAKILKYSLDRSPVALVSRDVRQALTSGPGAARSEALGKIVTGSAMAAVLYELLGDRMSGKAPLGSQQRALWEEAGNREYSIRIGDSFVKFDALGPLGLVTRIMADYYDAVANIDLANDEGAYDLLSDMAMNLTMPWVAAIKDMTFMMTFGSLIDSVEKTIKFDDSLYMQREISRFASSFVWSGLSSVAQVIDPNRHNPANPWEAAMVRMPGFSAKVPVRYNMFGEPIKYSSNRGAENMPYAMSQDINDELANYLIEELEFEVPRLTRKVGVAKLTAQEYEAYQIYAGQGVGGAVPLRRAMTQTLEALVRTGVPKRQIEVTLRQLIIDYRKMAREAMRMDPRFDVAQREAEIKKQLEM